MEGSPLVWWIYLHTALFPTSRRAYVWRTLPQEYDLECLIPQVKHGQVPSWFGGAISWYSVCLIITMYDIVTGEDYISILGGQVHLKVQRLFLGRGFIYHDNKVAIYTTHTVQSWSDEHEDEVSYHHWPPQSIDLNIKEPLWSIFEIWVRDSYYPPVSLWDFV